MNLLKDKLKHHKVILASGSPRRQLLLKGLEIEFDIVSGRNVDETYPSSLPKTSIPVFLAEKKASAPGINYDPGTIVITADTIVWCNEKVMNKPAGRDEAISMLKELSGIKHEVISGVCVKSQEKLSSFYSLTSVYFRELLEEEIIYYVDNFRPYDKAGAYGIQEWIGYTGIEAIRGSYFNVMGLPLNKLYKTLIDF